MTPPTPGTTPPVSPVFCNGCFAGPSWGNSAGSPHYCGGTWTIDAPPTPTPPSAPSGEPTARRYACTACDFTTTIQEEATAHYASGPQHGVYPVAAGAPTPPTPPETRCTATTGGGRYRCCLIVGHSEPHRATGFFTTWTDEPAAPPTPPSPGYTGNHVHVWMGGPAPEPLVAAPPTPSGIGPLLDAYRIGIMGSQLNHEIEGVVHSNEPVDESEEVAARAAVEAEYARVVMERDEQERAATEWCDNAVRLQDMANSLRATVSTLEAQLNAEREAHALLKSQVAPLIGEENAFQEAGGWEQIQTLAARVASLTAAEHALAVEYGAALFALADAYPGSRWADKARAALSSTGEA